jgi:hypothetical protein
MQRAIPASPEENHVEGVQRRPNGSCAGSIVRPRRQHVYAEAWQAHSCGSVTEIFIAIDVAARRIVVAMKDIDEPLLIMPADAGRPPTAREERENWRRQWKQ